MNFKLSKLLVLGFVALVSTESYALKPCIKEKMKPAEYKACIAANQKEIAAQKKKEQDLFDSRYWQSTDSTKVSQLSSAAKAKRQKWLNDKKLLGNK